MSESWNSIDLTELSGLSSEFTLEKVNHFFNFQRFDKEFKIVKEIGSGGFAKVFEAICLHDGRTYALKRIKLDVRNKSLKRLQKEIDTVLNEIRCMVKIQSENVVKYHQSWIEAELKNTELEAKISSEIPNLNRKRPCRRHRSKRNSILKKKKNDSVESCLEKRLVNTKEILLISDLEDVKTSRINLDLTLEFSSNGGDSGISSDNFGNSSYSFDDSYNNSDDSEDSYSNLKRTSKFQSSLNMSDDQYLKLDNSSLEIKKIKNLTAYIQMEICKETLGDYINSVQRDFQDEVVLKMLKMFTDISNSVLDLHDKEKIIHRDLKPNNIFISHSNNVKIGDFGLSTEIFDMKYKRFSFCENELETCSTRKNSENSSSSHLGFELFSSKHSQISYHTKNVGTPQYASPEQLNDNYYDNKCDVYSLGLILFEMLYPIKTGMEKHKIFFDLKQRAKVPESFALSYPGITALIVGMVDPNPNKRPDLKEVLSCVNEEMTKMSKSS